MSFKEELNKFVDSPERDKEGKDYRLGIVRGAKFAEKYHSEKSKKLLEALKRCSTVCEGANEDILKGLLVTSCKIVEEIADKAITQYEEGE